MLYKPETIPPFPKPVGRTAAHRQCTPHPARREQWGCSDLFTPTHTGFFSELSLLSSLLSCLPSTRVISALFVSQPPSPSLRPQSGAARSRLLPLEKAADVPAMAELHLFTSAGSCRGGLLCECPLLLRAHTGLSRSAPIYTYVNNWGWILLWICSCTVWRCGCISYQR